MPRIAAMFDRQGNRPDAALRQMLDSYTSQRSVVRNSCGHGSFAIGSVSWDDNALLVTDELCAVIDGFLFYHDAPLPLANLAMLYRENGGATGVGSLLADIEGHFTLALLDRRSTTLIVARDRFGVKPCYTADTAGGLAIASQPRALLQLDGVSRTPNPDFVTRYAAGHYRYIDAYPDQSAYSAIAQLPAAHMLILHDGKVRQQRYWQITDAPDLTDPQEDLALQLSELFTAAVRRALHQSDRPVFSLSGGMDSSSVLATAATLRSAKQDAISTIYHDKTYDEADAMRPMVAAHVNQWHAVPIGTPEVFNTIRQMVDVHDEPVATATWLAHYLLSARTRHLGYDGLFGGLGGDELNAGEYEYFPYFFADLRAHQQVDQLDEEIRWWARYHDHPLYRKSEEQAHAAMRRLTDPRQPGRCQTDQARLLRYADTLHPEWQRLEGWAPCPPHPFDSYLKNRCYQDIFFETAPCCLRALDRHAFAYGFDSYLPFFDTELTQFMFRIPGHLKIRRGVTKFLLREAMRNRLPAETRTSVNKVGWNAPAHVWFTGANQQHLLDIVRGTRFRNLGIYNCHRVEELIREHNTIVTSNQTRENHMMFLWQMVNLAIWLDAA